MGDVDMGMGVCVGYESVLVWVKLVMDKYYSMGDMMGMGRDKYG